MHPERPEPTGRPLDLADFVRRTLVVAGIVVLLLLLWNIHSALLLVFAGVLLAVFVHGLASVLSRHTPISQRWSVLVVGVLLVAVLVGFWWYLGPRVAEQFGRLAESLPSSYAEFKQTLGEQPWGEPLANYMPETRDAALQQLPTSNIMGMAATALDALSGLVMVLFIGIFLLVDPGLYVRGIVRLVPKSRRGRAEEVLSAIRENLWRWLLGRWVAVLFVFVSVSVGLWLIGVPLAFVLGLIAGVLDFVPFIGPTVAAVPGILLAFTVGPTKALFALLLYLAVQQLEGNVVTPIVQQRAVSVPPALLLFSLAAAGLLFGLLGILLATPLLVVAMVSVKMLYVEDALGDDVDVHGTD